MGSDVRDTYKVYGKHCFNSRSRMGSDSIPAVCYLLLTSFNSRSRMGSDPSIGSIRP